VHRLEELLRGADSLAHTSSERRAPLAGGQPVLAHRGQDPAEQSIEVEVGDSRGLLLRDADHHDPEPALALGPAHEPPRDQGCRSWSPHEHMPETQDAGCVDPGQARQCQEPCRQRTACTDAPAPLRRG
jgi:hypothetical protein